MPKTGKAAFVDVGDLQKCTWRVFVEPKMYIYVYLYPWMWFIHAGRQAGVHLSPAQLYSNKDRELLLHWVIYIFMSLLNGSPPPILELQPGTPQLEV